VQPSKKQKLKLTPNSSHPSKEQLLKFTWWKKQQSMI